MSDTGNLANDLTSPSESAATMLRTAREALGMTQQDVAQELYLTPAYIVHIDADEMDKIAKQAFVRGYLRAYAKLVKIDPDLVVARFDLTKVPEPEAEKIRGVTEESVGSINFTGPVFQTGVIGLVGLIFIVGLVWFFTHESSDQTAVPIEAIQAEDAPIEIDTDEDFSAFQALNRADTEIDVNEGSEAGTNDEPNSDDVASDRVLLSSSQETNKQPTTQTEVDQTQQSTVREAHSNSVAESQSTSSTTSDNENSATEVSSSDVVSKPSSEVSITRINGVKTVDAHGDDELRFSFTDDCWVEITDAAGRPIYGDLNRANDELVVYGVAPFEVLFGKAPAASMLFNGTKVDLRKHTTSVDTAKVRVGG